ncbi:MAG: STAS domain-containing protein [Gammaproteobacteria bacterium]|nr:STAS domain-containing protein [Gammaproteobacteria bacterium]
MSETNITQISDGQLAVEGELSKFTVPSIMKQGHNLINNANQNLAIDLKGVTRTDSAGLALLLEWMTLASKKDLQIHFKNLPSQLLKIAKVSDLDVILPLAD